MLTSLRPTLNLFCEVFFPPNELEIAHVKSEGIKKQWDGTDGHALAAGFKSWSGQRGQRGRRGRRKKLQMSER